MGQREHESRIWEIRRAPEMLVLAAKWRLGGALHCVWGGEGRGRVVVGTTEGQRGCCKVLVGGCTM